MYLGVSFSAADANPEILGEGKGRQIFPSQALLGSCLPLFITHHKGVIGSFLLSLLTSVNLAVRFLGHPWIWSTVS